MKKKETNMGSNHLDFLAIAAEEIEKDLDNMEVKALVDIVSPRAAFLPPKRVSISKGAAANLVIKPTGGSAAPWSEEETPYMVEPMNTLASREHEAVIFVGPARTGKTASLLLGWMAHNVINDPGDMLFVQMSQEKARDFSKTDIDRALKYSPNIKAQMSSSGKADNLHDKMFRHGMWLKIAWPTVSNLSGSSYRYVAFTDLDRMPDDIGGEGSPFMMGKKRTTTFMSRGMTLAESSPGRDIVDPNWRPATPHEAPPCGGILGLYNGGHRKRWYWKCPHCSEWFEAAPGLSLFNLPADDILASYVRETSLDALANDYNRVVCPNNSCVILPKDKPGMNRVGRWLSDGQSLDEQDVLHGDEMKSPIASYWLGGVAATYQNWKSMLLTHFTALRQYELTGDEENLKVTCNTDQGMPYMPQTLRAAKNQSLDPAENTNKELKRYVCPDETRTIVASVDVQGGQNARFIVQIHAVGEHMEQWLIDRYELKWSTRPGMGTEFAPIDPAKHPEDWDVLTEKVVRSTYKTNEEGVEMRIRLTVVDSGGEEGTTDKAYAWYRSVRRAGMANRIMLIKGASSPKAPMIKETMVGGTKTEANDIPLYMLNPNTLKDAVYNGFQRVDAGPQRIHFPSWLTAAFFDELKAEVRQKNGVWKQIRSRNESLDLCYYIRAGLLRMGYDRINWALGDDALPTWCRSIENNSEKIAAEVRREMQQNTPIPSPLGHQPTEVRTRRSSRSSALA
jgi:phage terminase large subunit GpA-like protein